MRFGWARQYFHYRKNGLENVRLDGKGGFVISIPMPFLPSLDVFVKRESILYFPCSYEEWFEVHCDGQKPIRLGWLDSFFCGRIVSMLLRQKRREEDARHDELLGTLQEARRK